VRKFVLEWKTIKTGKEKYSIPPYIVMYFRIHINISATTAAAENSVHKVHCIKEINKSVISIFARK
jgi:hypothetical protein